MHALFPTRRGRRSSVPSSGRRPRPWLAAEPLEARLLMAGDAAASGSVSRLVWQGEPITARTDGWILRVDEGPRPPAVRSGWQARPLGEGFFSLTTPGASAADVLGWATATTGFRSLEPDRLITASAVVPNDPSFRRLWGLDNSGQTGGVVDADIDATEAWDVTTGSRGVVVAVVDTGVDFNHPDLAANMWRNPGETAGDGIDNDRNGFVDDVYGWNFAANNPNVFDDNSHGTHVAGTIGAVGNDGRGVAGVNWQVSIMALKFLDSSGSGSTSAAIAALNYATMMRRTYGVNVVATNNSWGGGGSSPALRAAIAAGSSAGILCIAAAGNEGLNNDVSGSYPANDVGTSGIAVAAVDASNRLASFSNYGATQVQVCAPGVGIYSTTPNNGYASYSGTSMATPHVTGLVALLAAANPRATASQIRAAILSSVTPVSGLAGKCSTGGVVNAAAAVRAIVGSLPPISDPPPPPVVTGPFEPNDSLATATVVSLSAGSATLSGVVGDGAHGAADVDLFAVQLAAGATLAARIDAAKVSPSATLDSFLRVFTAAGAEVAFNDDSGGSVDSFVRFTAAASGTYYVGVSSFGNTGYAAVTAGSGVAGETAGGYALAISVALPPPVADIVDVSPDPRTTSVGAVLVRFDRAVTGFDASDLVLTRNGAVVPLSGVAVTTVDNVTWTVGGLDPLTVTEGSYTLVLRAGGSGIVSVGGGVPLASSADEAWLVRAATLTDAGDTIASAAVVGITSGETRLSGSIGDGANAARDVDLYRVTLAAGQSLVIDVDAQSLPGGSTLDSYLRIFSGSGQQLAWNDDAGGSLDSYLSVRSNSGGTFYVGISGYRNFFYAANQSGSGSAGSIGSYQVRFAFSPLVTTTGAARIAGFRDGTDQRAVSGGLAGAFAAYGANWNAAIPAAAVAQRPARRPWC